MGPGKGDRFLSAGEYLGWRLLELGVRQMYCVPGDFNLPLLDSLARVPGLLIVNCASELGCAYAAGEQQTPTACTVDAVCSFHHHATQTCALPDMLF
jgi:hypothetical protein